MNNSFAEIGQNTKESPGDLKTCGHTNFSGKQSANAGMKNSQKRKIGECSKLAREYETRQDWVGKMIHWELYKKFKFDHTNKWYMNNPTPVLENEMHRLPCGFNLPTDHLISAREPDLIIINK